MNNRLSLIRGRPRCMHSMLATLLDSGLGFGCSRLDRVCIVRLLLRNV